MIVFTRGAGTTRTTDAYYYQRRNDPFGNVCNKIVESPEISNTYFTYWGTIDFHNKLHQGHLKLQKMENPRSMVLSVNYTHWDT